MASRAPTVVPAFKAQSFPFDISHLQQRVGVATASEELAPKAVKRKARITSKGLLITDGSGRAFRKTPDFEDVLRNLWRTTTGKSSSQRGPSSSEPK